MGKVKDLLRKLKTGTVVKGNTLSSSPQDNLIPSNISDKTQQVVQQEAARFTEKRSLVEIMDGDPPIVYSSNFGTRIVGKYRDETDEKSDAIVIDRRMQYGYEGKDAIETEKDEYDHDFKQQTGDKVLPALNIESKTAKYLTEQETFDDRWKRMKQDLEDQSEDKIVEIKE